MWHLARERSVHWLKADGDGGWTLGPALVPKRLQRIQSYVKVAHELEQERGKEETAISHEEAETESQERKRAILHREAHRKGGERGREERRRVGDHPPPATAAFPGKPV